MTKEFVINPKSIANAELTINPTSFIYDGTKKQPQVTIKDGDVTLTTNDYSVSYTSNINAGNGKVTISGKNNYTGTFTEEFVISPKPISKVEISITPESYIFDGTAKRPEVTIKDGTKTLIQGTDYIINSYSNNVNVGTATLTVLGKGNYNSYAKKKYTIGQKSVSGMTITLDKTEFTYDGEAKQPLVTIKDGTKTLVLDTDYIVRYENNVDVGTAKAVIIGKGSYGESVTKTFVIKSKPVKDISGIDITINPLYCTYSGTAQTPAVTIKDGKINLTSGKDYTIAYSGNVDAGTAKVTITGNGEYTGTAEKSFYITPASVSKAVITLESDCFEYSGYPCKPNLNVKIGTRTLTKNTDYRVIYSDNVNVGKATVEVQGRKNYTGSVQTHFLIVNPKNEFVWKQDNWNFNNWKEYFDNGEKTYRQMIDDEYKQKLAKNLNNDDYDRIFKGDFRHKAWLDELWQGACYGMSATAFLSEAGLVPYSQYHKGASSLNELSVNDKNVKSLINYYQLLQIKEMSNFVITANNENQKNLEQIISLLDENGVVMVGIKQPKTDFAHEVLAYKYEYGSWSIKGVTYTGRILVCDPNCSSNKYSSYTDQHIYFNYKTYQWVIPMYLEQYCVSSAQEAVFNHISADINEINEGGYLSGYIGMNKSADFVARLDAYAVSDNRSVVKVRETSGGNYMNLAPSPGEIEESYSYIMQGGKQKGTLGYNLYDSTAAYKLEQYDPVDMQLSLKYENCRLSAASAAGNRALFDSKGFVEVQGESAEYYLSMVFNEDYPTDWFKVEVCGANETQASLKKGKTGYVLSGDNLKNVRIYTSNREDSASISFSTEYDAVYIYEIDKNTIGLKVDRDGNGTYETKIKGTPILENNSYISSKNIKIGESVTVIASAKGGSGTLKYAVYYKKKTDTAWISKQNFSTNTTISIKPEKAGDYDICVKVRDENGNVEKKYFELNVYYILTNRSLISDTSIFLGNTVNVHASASGGTGDYKYAVYYKKTSDTKWTVKQDFNKNQSVSVKPAKATEYNICVKVKDGSGSIEKKYFVIKVYDVLTNTSTVSPSSIGLGSEVAVKCSAKGGAGSYTYAVLYKKKSDTKWTVKQDFSKNQSVSIKLAKATEYNICVKVKDGNGSIEKKYFEITVK